MRMEEVMLSTLYPQQLLNILSAMREGKILCDLELVLENGDSFHVHKTILAAGSKCFRNLFMSGAMNLCRYEIKNVDSDILQQLLNFLYTGQMKVTADNVVGLLTASSQLEMDEPKDVCTEFLQRMVQEANVNIVTESPDRLAFQHVKLEHDEQMSEIKPSAILHSKHNNVVQLDSSATTHPQPLTLGMRPFRRGRGRPRMQDRPVNLNPPTPPKVRGRRRGRPPGSRAQRALMQARMKAEASSKPHCHSCGKQFCLFSLLQMHLKVHQRRVFAHKSSPPDGPELNIGTGEYSCPKCQKTFTMYTLYQLHWRKFHQISRYCNICLRRFASRRLLQMHRHTIHCLPLLTPHHRMAACVLCRRIFANKRAAFLHCRMHGIPQDGHILVRPIKQHDVLIEEIHRQPDVPKTPSKTSAFPNSSELAFLSKLRPIAPRPVGMVLNDPFPVPRIKQKRKRINFNDQEMRVSTKMEDGARYLVCMDCGFQTLYRSSILRHKVKHDPNAGVLCDTCGKKFADATRLRKHYDEVHLHKTYSCQHCPETFKSRTGYDCHVNGLHLNKFQFRCHICDKGFFFRKPHRQHLLMHEKAKNPRRNKTRRMEGLYWRELKDYSSQEMEKVSVYHCEEGRNNVVTIPIKGRQEPEYERQENGKFECQSCPKSYSELYMMQEHLRFVHRQKLKCEQCSKEFSSTETLRTHVKLFHKGPFRHQCPYCHKLFYYETQFKKHITRHVNKVGDKKTLCEMCNISYDSEIIAQHIIECSRKMIVHTNRTIEIDQCQPLVIEPIETADAMLELEEGQVLEIDQGQAFKIERNEILQEMEQPIEEQNTFLCVEQLHEP